MNALTPIIPVFDPESPDATLLNSFERVRALRAWIYSFDGQDVPADVEAQIATADDQSLDHEKIIREWQASTIPAVVARLLILIPLEDPSRWVDRGLVQHGFLAIYRERENLDGHGEQLARAAHELIAIEWRQNLAAYEESTETYVQALRVLGDVDEGSTAEVLLDRLLKENERSLQRLVRTLAPDHDAYRQKVEICLNEGLGTDAARWGARDVAYLLGGEASGEVK